MPNEILLLVWIFHFKCVDFILFNVLERSCVLIFEVNEMKFYIEFQMLKGGCNKLHGTLVISNIFC